jgi:hypothetical protein
VFWTATNATEPMLLYLGFISQDWSTYKGGVQGLLIGRGAAFHAAQFAMIRKTRSAPREPFAQHSHGGSTCKNQRHAHHSLLRLDQTRQMGAQHPCTRP